MRFPDPQPLTVPHQQSHGETQFPFALACSPGDGSLQDTLHWVTEERHELLRLTGLHGAVLLRGFPIQTAEMFDEVVAALGLTNFPYDQSLSNAVRINRTERVFSANEAPPEVRIFLHHEMAQTPLYPKWIFFHCEVAAEQGGATPLCRSDVLLEHLEAAFPEFVAACRAKGLKYTNVMPGDNDQGSGMGRSWRSTLGVETREGAESRLAELGYSWQWRENGDLAVTTPALSAVMATPDGRQVFFNQLIAACCGWKDARNDPSQSLRHGDGTPLDREAVLYAVKVAEELSFDLEWRAGDVALLDNTLTMHARRPFRGTRRVVASLAEMQRQRFAPIEP